MHSCILWMTVFILFGLTLVIRQLRTELYMTPVAIFSVYLFFNQYPSFARRMHQRKLTYEDLEDLQDADPELQARFQVVFTRIQQIGGSLCAGVLVMYGFHIFEGNMSLFESVGVLGGLLSLYARVFGYVGNFFIAFLYRLKKTQYESTDESKRSSQDTNPHPDKPQETN